MSALLDLSEEEAALFAILSDTSGVDIAEFLWDDSTNDSGIFRCHDYQLEWFTCLDTYQVDQGARAVGKSLSIQMRACAFSFNFIGQDMLLTAPELNHLRPLTSAIEDRLRSNWLFRQMLPLSGKSDGFTKVPHWECRFLNGAKIISRLPNKDGRGVKGSCTAGTIILTRRGLIPIEEVTDSDEVWTHENRWRRVIANVRSDGAELVTVGGMGHRGMTVSWNHRFQGRRNSNPQRTRNLSSPTWVSCDDAELDRWYMASPVRFDSALVPAEFLSLTQQNHGDLADLFWLLGSYVADGYVSNAREGEGRRIGITDDLDSCAEIMVRAKSAGFNPYVVDQRRDTRARRVEVCSTALSNAAERHFGRLSEGKAIPVWLLGVDRALRQSFLDGYLFGDGAWAEDRQRWDASTASKPLAVGLKLLAQSLGSQASYSWVDPKVTQICGVPLKKTPRRSHRVQIKADGIGIFDRGFLWRKARKAVDAGIGTVYSLTVDEDHSYISDGIVSHNQHVIAIELDEANDYPPAGWVEIVECLNRFQSGSMWRCHGVARGVRDRFYEITTGADSSQWTVHRPMAFMRPSWDSEERSEKIGIYGGSRQNPDYKRNIYGEHGDATNPVFVLSRFVQNLDTDLGSEYNTDVYSASHIEFEDLEAGMNPVFKIDIPSAHKTGWSEVPDGYSAYFGGMDVGATNHPSEVLIFGQRAKEKGEKLDLLLRVHMRRISMADQLIVVQHLFSHYGSKLKTFGIDKTGIGFTLWEQLDKLFGNERLKGYHFSDKLPVMIEDRPLERGETLEDLVVERSVVEFATDALREIVDARSFLLPFDKELTQEWLGQSYMIIKSSGNPYGKREYGQGSYHCVDEATEILTDQGWKTYDQLSPGHTALTLDMDSGSSRWSKVDAVNIFDGPPEMLSMETGWHSSLTTPGHRWPVRTYHSGKHTYGELHFRTTEELSYGSCVPTAVPCSDLPTVSTWSDDVVELIGWYWMAGSAHRANTTITQSFREHPENCERIRRSLTNLFGHPGYDQSGRGSRQERRGEQEGIWREYRDETRGTSQFWLRGEAAELVRGLAPKPSEGRVTPLPKMDFITSLTEGQLHLFLEVSELGDGLNCNDDRRTFQHLRDLDQNRMIETICALLGLAVSTHSYARERSRSGMSHTTAIFNNGWHDTPSGKQPPGLFIRPRGSRQMVPYVGKVWCPTTRDGTWLARRNGTIYWTGNSLDAAKMMIAAKRLAALDALLKAKPEHNAVLDVFVGF